MDSKKQAQGIASLGRYGDTTLMHMRPDEVEQLTAISRANGGDITINPKTGMPEAFLGDFFSALAPTAAGIAAGAFFPPAYAPYLAAGAGGLTAYAQGKRDPLGIAMGALGGYGGGNIGQGLVAQGAPAVPAGSAESSLIQPIQPTNAAINTTGYNPALSSPGATTASTNAYSPALTSSGGRGITGVQAQQVYKPINTTGRPSFTPEAVDIPYQNQFNVGPQQMLDSSGKAIPPLQGPVPVDKSPLQQGFEYSQGQLSKLGSGIKNVITDSESRSRFFSDLGGGNETYGMFKTAMPVLGAGAETYLKNAYEGMPTYEESSAGMYDPTRRLNLNMDTGLRLLAQGGKVAFEEGGVVRDPSYYGINPQYNTTGATYSPIMGMQGGRQTRVPVMGFVDVGGKFVADPKGTMSDIDYENRFKYVTEGVAKPKDSSGDMTDLNAAAAGGAGINPAVALQAAQGYADTQQSDLNQQGGKTTAEMNTVKAATPPPATTMDLMLAKKNEEEMANQGLPAGLNIQAIQAQQQQQGMAVGGIAGLTPDNGKMLNGNGDGVSDEIPAMIEGEQEAALSDGEFIVPARIVSELGNGSSDAGAQKLYTMIDRIQAARSKTMGDNKEYAKDTNAERYLPA